MLKLKVACGCAVLLSWAALADAQQPLIPLSAEQQRSTGVQVEAAHPPGPEELATTKAGTALQLSGHVTIPNASIDLLLANVAGSVASVQVNVGDPVRPGQVLAYLRSADLLALQRAYLGARSQSELADLRATRDEALFKDGIIAENRLQATRAESVQAQAILLEQRQLLRIAGMGNSAIAQLRSAADMTPQLAVTAQRAGSVLEQGVSVGQRVEAGASLFRIAALDLLWLELQATREQASQLAVGDTVQIAGCAVRGRLIATGVQLATASQTITVRAEFKGAASCAAPNQYLQATVSPAGVDSKLICVPAESVVHREGKDYVFVQESTGFRPVPVEVDRRQGGQAWLRSGVSAGTKVASRGVAALKGSWLGLGATAPANGAAE